MKRLFLLFFTVILLLAQTSCIKGGDIFNKSALSPQDKIGDSFEKLMKAVKERNAEKVKILFSENLQDLESFNNDVNEFIDFIEGDIFSYTSIDEGGFGLSGNIDYGKRIKVAECCFTVRTTKNKYHIAISECIEDDYDSKNIGVESVYIIDSKNWYEEGLYRGDGKWTKGINIVRDVDLGEQRPLKSVLTREYDLESLKGYFEERQMDWLEFFQNDVRKIYYEDVNKDYPIEAIRPGGVSAYKVSQGGYYYVFWSDASADDTAETDDLWMYYSVYLPSSEPFVDYDILKTGISTAEDVKKLSPSFEMYYTEFGGLYSYIYLNKEEILEIEYQIRGEGKSYKDLIVDNIMVISRTGSNSHFASVNSTDLPY